MIFEFVVIYQSREGEPILGVLRERLRESLEANLNDVEVDTLANMVRAAFERPQPANGDGISRVVLGFSLDLPDETASVREVLDEFADSLIAPPIEHAVKFEDPLLCAELASRARELFALEMKLRRVLSIIYLHAYPEADPYDLLTEETVQPMAKDKPQKEQMKAAAENQFSHLTFGQYVGLNQRPAIKDIVSLIRNEANYEAFRDELLRQPVQHEDDASFLAGLKERMDSIEKMRNAVAHNRRASRKTTNDYLNARPLVNQALDDYLSALATDWQYSLSDGEMPWDTAARRAVEQAMQSATWHQDEGTVELLVDDASHGKLTISCEEELIAYLGELARGAFGALCPREDDEFLFSCNARGIVEGVLGNYQEQLAEVFCQAQSGEEG